MSTALLGFTDALRPNVVLFVFAGVLLGYFVGVLPGLNRPAALAIAVPLSYYMTPLSAVAFLIGIAKASAAQLTIAGQVFGTPAYMSPEQCQGLPLDARTDVYSLAVIAYRLLGGALPFAGRGDALIEAHISQAPRPLAELRRGLPKQATALIMRALAKSPERQSSFTTISGRPIDRLFTPEDVTALDYGTDLGDPGVFPYTRGIHPTGYRGKLWTMRQFAGFGSAPAGACALARPDPAIMASIAARIRADGRFLISVLPDRHGPFRAVARYARHAA